MGKLIGEVRGAQKERGWAATRLTSFAIVR
jgi:hypothetical protein